MAVPGKLYRDGNTLKLQNFSGHPKLLIVEQFGFNHYFNNEIFQWINTLAQTGVNAMRVFGFWPFGRGHEEEPYARTGNSYDLNRFNERYFDYLKQWVPYANEKGIFVQYELFDSCGFWQTSFAPFNPFYQIVKADHRAFSDLNNRQLVDIQKRYVRKVIETIRPDRNLNLMIGIMNEFKGRRPDWHREMSKYVKSLAPHILTSGSMEDSPAANDSTVDIWAVHTGTYDFKTGKPNVPSDIRNLRRQTGDHTILAYSTDGFGTRGMFRETPDDMRRLVQDVNRAGLQIFSFLDQKAYNPSNPSNASQSTWPGSAARLNVETYRAIVAEFRPTPSPKSTGGEGPVTPLPPPVTETLPEGYLDIFDISRLPSTHKGAFVEGGGKAIKATSKQGFLCYGQYKTGYPQKPLRAYFSILIDNNTADDRNILILDVYDHHSDRVLGKRTVTRKDFSKVNDFCLFEFDFTPPSGSARMEFRIYYMGWSYILANKIAVVDPTKVSIDEASEIPFPGFVSEQPSHPVETPETPQTPEIDSEYCSGNEFICLPLMTPEAVSGYHGNLLGGKYQDGQFIPSATGGIEFSLTIDTSRRFAIDFVIEGNIPNWHKGEHDGGKPSLFTMEALDGSYYLNLQRMYVDYRGGGLFRILFGPRSNNTSSLITHRDLSGHYDMKNWGDEPHHFQVIVGGYKCQLKIDSYQSKWTTAPSAISGQKQIRFILGNRELSRLGMGQGVETRFQRVKILYI